METSESKTQTLLRKVWFLEAEVDLFSSVGAFSPSSHPPEVISPPSEKETPLTSAGSLLCTLRATMADSELIYTFRVKAAPFKATQTSRRLFLMKTSRHSTDVMK